jgi:hypothetical protein
MDEQKLRELTRDLRKTYPRSPRDLLGGYVIAARTVDKCRATLIGVNGEYSYWPCSLAARLFEFTGLTPDHFRDRVAAGLNDEELGQWLARSSKVQDRLEVIRWNNQLRDTRLSELPIDSQEYLEDIQIELAKKRPVYVWFDVYDIEEGRL